MEGNEALGPVLVGVSGSPDSDRAVDWAADHAAMTGRRLVVTHGTGFVGVRPNAQDLLEAERVALEAGRLIVDAAVERAHARAPHVEVSGSVDVGDPPTVLLEQAGDAAVLVVGSRHDVALRRLFGSVSLGVVRHAPCPVVVVRPPAREQASPLGERVILGLDGTASSRDAAAFAFEYAAFAKLPLMVLHGSWDRLSRGSAVMGVLSDGESRSPTEEEELTIAESIAGLPEEFPEVVVQELHRSGDPAEALVEASEMARLVVVGSRGTGPARSLLRRSVSTALAEHAHCPVAVVHPRAVSS